MPLANYYHQANTIEAGCDEAGRGCLAGAVFAAAVVLPPHFYHPLLNDSKQMTHSQRYLLRSLIEQQAVAWAVAQVSPAEIDRLNILRASIAAMHQAVAQLGVVPQLLLIDGNQFTSHAAIPHVCIVKGDAQYAAIAAASVLAKTHRDDYMLQLHQQYPLYDWQHNKGYPTLAHRTAIAQHGTTPYHRLSFKLQKTLW